MTLVAIETATPLIGCALWGERGPVASFSLVGGRRHAETLIPAIDDLCRRCGLSPADLDGVAVDVGPGLFTGLRVGLATARSLAHALSIPVVGVTSLETLAYPHRRRPGLVAAVVDARRAEVFWAMWRSDGDSLEVLVEPTVASPQEAAERLGALAGSDRILVVGDGALRYGDVLACDGVDLAGESDAWPSPWVVAELGSLAIASGAPGAAVEPLYLRQADVRIGWEQADGLTGMSTVAPG